MCLNFFSKKYSCNRYFTLTGAAFGYYLFGALRISIQAQERNDLASINGDQSATVSSLPDEPIMS